MWRGTYEENRQAMNQDCVRNATSHRRQSETSQDSRKGKNTKPLHALFICVIKKKQKPCSTPRSSYNPRDKKQPSWPSIFPESWLHSLRYIQSPPVQGRWDANRIRPSAPAITIHDCLCSRKTPIAAHRRNNVANPQSPQSQGQRRLRRQNRWRRPEPV